MQATGKNPNPFFEMGPVVKPIISAEAKLDSLTIPKNYVYDIPTEAGNEYTFVAQ
jgi:alpha-L-fucosidase 2